jgi:hypothetical protein|uniref:Uncharacterized protein n=1 Tax=viral metagenome TaxID=1070528 RepID=A0A6C0CDD7_9ZZZZ
MFKDISQFDNTDDYLPIIVAILIVEVITIVLSFTNITQSSFLKVWYKKYLLSAVLADVSLIFLGFVIARALYYNFFDEFSILNFILLLVIIQVIHDILFYIIITSIPKGTNKIIDILKDYADEISYYAILGDSAMMISSALIAGYIANFDANTNIIMLAFFIYILQFILYTY